MVKVNYNAATGEIKGFYPDSIIYSSIPEPYIEIDKATHQECIDNPGLRKVDLTTLKVVECELATVTQTTDEKIAALDVEYQPQFQSLQLSWAAASMDGDTATADSIKLDYTTLKAEYQTKLEAINNG